MITPGLRAQIVVCRNIVFDQQKSAHSANDIINKMDAPLFPSVVKPDVLVKLLWSEEPEVDLELHIVNPREEIVFHHTFTMKNMRAEGQWPGMDISFHTRFFVEERGCHMVKLFAEYGDTPLVQYPVWIYEQ